MKLSDEKILHSLLAISKVIIHKLCSSIPLSEQNTLIMVVQPNLSQKKLLLKRSFQFLVPTLQCLRKSLKKIAYENMKKRPQKLLIISFYTTNQPKTAPTSFLSHKNCSPRDLCIMTLTIRCKIRPISYVQGVLFTIVHSALQL